MKRSRLVAMLGGLALLGALTVGSVTSVFGATEWATVTGYAPGTAANNNPDAGGTTARRSTIRASPRMC